MATDEMKRAAEEMRRAGEEAQRGAREFDFRGMAKAWKDAYLAGLDANLKWQEENERLMKDAIKQGVNGSRQWLTLYKNWVEMPWDQIQAQQTGIPNPFLAISRQAAQAMHGAADPWFKTAADSTESAYANYETAMARPSRKYILDLNRRTMDTFIPS